MVIKQKCFDTLRDAIACVEISARGGVPEGGFSKTGLKDINAFMFHRVGKILEEYENDFGDHWELEDENGEIVEFEAGTLVNTLLCAAELYRS